MDNENILDKNIERMLIEDCTEEIRSVYWNYLSRGLSHEQIMACIHGSTWRQ